MADPLRYRGMNRRGVGVVGTLGPPESLARHVEELFDKGWRWLEVTQGDVEVAGIVRHPDTNKRVWWADDDAPHSDRHSADGASS